MHSSTNEHILSSSTCTETQAIAIYIPICLNIKNYTLCPLSVRTINCSSMFIYNVMELRHRTEIYFTRYIGEISSAIGQGLQFSRQSWASLAVWQKVNEVFAIRVRKHEDGSRSLNVPSQCNDVMGGVPRTEPRRPRLDRRRCREHPAIIVRVAVTRPRIPLQ